ncbi:hypothetical protein E2C01_045226 [Portunus trituberculatus]|uniref:Uncharacterized protein n=1 Tax=Portunus trituberculatus TaxID=210409 RepID=A0A5B7FXR4_PORTR|nr:hypothetical protein [Portunus trituberculatus]
MQLVGHLEYSSLQWPILSCFFGYYQICVELPQLLQLPDTGSVSLLHKTSVWSDIVFYPE